MKTSIRIFSLLFLVYFLISGCSATDYLFKEKPETEQDKLSKLMTAYKDSSIAEVNFDDMKKHPENYTDKYFRLKGYIIDEKNIEFLFYADPYFDNNYGYYIISIDNPLPKQSAPGTPLKYLAVGDKVTLIAQMKGLSSYELKNPKQINVNNYTLSFTENQFVEVPLLKGIAIYKIDDNYLRVPQWVSADILEEFGYRK